MSTDCYVQRFLLENLDIRGVVVHLGEAWRSLQEGRNYPLAVRQLLGEMTAVTTILGEQLKQDGRLTFQVRGQGDVRMLVMDCERSQENLRLRGMARAEPGVTAAPLPQLLGNGQLLMSLDLPESRQPFQSIVPLQGDTVAEVFEHFLTQSEQQPSRLFLAADSHAAAGLFLQKMPGTDQRDADGWQRIQILAETVRADELLGLPADALLRRLFQEEDIRTFAPTLVVHYCPEDWDKVRSTLRSLGREEVQSILDEHGVIVVQDEICNREYHFDADDVARLFDPKAGGMH